MMSCGNPYKHKIQNLIFKKILIFSFEIYCSFCLIFFLGIHTLDFYISNVLNNTQIKGGSSNDQLRIRATHIDCLTYLFWSFYDSKYL